MLINCDLGECLIPNQDATIMPLIDMANIACGGHAGNDESMNKTIELAKANQVMVGAHVSYPDRENFGRKSMDISNDVLFHHLHSQMSQLNTLCEKQHAELAYVKPHGALYHDMLTKQPIFETLCKVVESLNKGLFLLVPLGFQPNTKTQLMHELFADRAYRDGTMVARSQTGAVLAEVDKIIRQYQNFASNKNCDSICFHSDNPASVQALKCL